MAITPAFWIGISLFVASVAIFIVLRIKYHNVAEKRWRKMQGLFSTLGFFFLALLAIDLVYYASFDLPEANRPDYKAGFILFDILIGFVLLLYVLSFIRYLVLIYRKKGGQNVQPKPPRISRIWNWDKALGGTVLADTANAIGVLGGIGAHAVFSGLDGWWWVGQFGALLAIIVGLSSFQRWLLEAPQNVANWWQSDRAALQASSILNILVGSLTLLSLMLPSDSNSSHVIANDVGPTGLTWIELFWFILIAVLFLITVVQFIIDPYRQQRQDASQKYAYGISILVILLLTLIPLIVFQTTATTMSDSYGGTAAGDVLGILAGFSWVAAEFWSFILISIGWRKRWDIDVPKYLTWEKNIWQFAGALIIIVFLSAKINQGANWVIPEGWTIAFAIGASFAGFGTVRGIFVGLINRFFKEREELAQQAQAQQVLRIQQLERGLEVANLRRQNLVQARLQLLQQQQQPQGGNQGGGNGNGG
jgi:glucan phosphoethanolaminetransferase (alkaline phosphatase superfamily)